MATRGKRTASNPFAIRYSPFALSFRPLARGRDGEEEIRDQHRHLAKDHPDLPAIDLREQELDGHHRYGGGEPDDAAPGRREPQTDRRHQIDDSEIGR